MIYLGSKNQSRIYTQVLWMGSDQPVICQLKHPLKWPISCPLALTPPFVPFLNKFPIKAVQPKTRGLPPYNTCDRCRWEPSSKESSNKPFMLLHCRGRLSSLSFGDSDLGITVWGWVVRIDQSLASQSIHLAVLPPPTVMASAAGSKRP